MSIAFVSSVRALAISELSLATGAGQGRSRICSEFILLGTDRDSDGVPWALLATDRDGHLAFAGPAILNPPQALRAAWTERLAELALTK
jgi:hypothetical protein